MKSFLTKKKGKDDSPGPRPSMDSESSGPFRMFGKKKPQEEDQKTDVDLSSALPSSDEFRTSLIMTGLSARFSMLREQDDPTTKVGKASDDSVLFPRRQSKLIDFGAPAGLQDISEVESIKTPSFDNLDSGKLDEPSNGADSIMNRTRPTDGNNLFGGRQKIYRIPANGSAVGKHGGMAGRALYDDDVAKSAFQKWRLAEKDKQTEDEQNDGLSESESKGARRRRETSSTASSVPSINGRNSSAATSVASFQPTAPTKEAQATPAASTSTNSNSLERNVTRTRRLYEQSLNRELHDQQSSAVSRMDSLSKSRAFGSLTPDLTSPTGGAFGDRFMDRRPILAKASAPNLRSFNPSAPTASPKSPAEASSKFLDTTDLKTNFSNPPLSPPISESEDIPSLSTHGNDRFKTLAAGGLDKLPPKYDESKYTQRQLERQQGRETPGNRSPTEGPNAKTHNAASTEQHVTSFLDDSDSASLLNNGMITPQLSLERPDDDDHPAFRKSALPTPLTLLSKSPRSLSPGRSVVEAPEDSPTLGPNGGLSSMVRAHLRTESNTSSLYEAPEAESTQPSPMPNMSTRQASAHSSRVSSVSEEADKEREEFARHLADGARRVREKLTTYVDGNPDRSTPLPTSPVESKELEPPRPNPLGILRSKSSRGSLFDRENRAQGQPRSIKTALSTTNLVGALPSPRKISSEISDDAARGRSALVRDNSNGDADRDENVPVGLKAFRQARRELQKMKDLDTKQRPQGAGAATERPPNMRAMSYDTSSPAYHRMRSESRNGTNSRTNSQAPSERDRSGSETSSNGRPGRLRNESLQEEYRGPSSPSGSVRSRLVNGISSPYDRPRNGGGLPATTSTPNLHAPPSGPPPLPPINPRRKNGLTRTGEDDSPVASPRMPGGFPGADDASDEDISMEQRRQKLRRATSEGNSLHGRAQNTPPRTVNRPPIPKGNYMGQF